jgi:large subunit ribosomal protein L18Ae
VFAKNAVLARSHFWYEMKRQNKVRKCQGEIVSLSEIFERKTSSIKNFGIVLKYRTRKDIVNMYKEYRATTLCGAVSQMFSEMAGRHSARAESIHIIKTVVLRNNAVIRDNTKQFMSANLRYPKFTHKKRAPTANQRSTFKATRPVLV